MAINGNSKNGSGPSSMMESYPRKGQCLYELHHTPDPSPVELRPEPNENRDDLEELQRGIEARRQAGDSWAWCIVVMIARWGQYSGMACLGQVSTTCAEDFAHPDNPDGQRLYDAAYEDLIRKIAQRYHTHVVDALSPHRAKLE